VLILKIKEVKVGQVSKDDVRRTDFN